MDSSIPKGIKNYYKPYSKVIENLDKILRFEAKKAEKKSEGGRLSPGDKKKRNQINRAKTDFFNRYIFPSMANLIYFLEIVNRSGATGIFEKELKELTGVINKPGDIILKFEELKGHPAYAQAFTFSRLINSFLDLHAIISESDNLPEQKDTTRGMIGNLNSFRLFLLQTMQRIISDTIVQLSTSNDDMFELVRQDMVRANSWASYFSTMAYAKIEEELNEMDLKAREPHRPVCF